MIFHLRCMASSSGLISPNLIHEISCSSCSISPQNKPFYLCELLLFSTHSCNKAEQSPPHNPNNSIVIFVYIQRCLIFQYLIQIHIVFILIITQSIFLASTHFTCKASSQQFLHYPFLVFFPQSVAFAVFQLQSLRKPLWSLSVGPQLNHTYSNICSDYLLCSEFLKHLKSWKTNTLSS